MVLAKGVDHCRAEEEDHRSLVESFLPRDTFTNDREHPSSCVPARMLISKVDR